jgi:hypothetical protein
MLAYVNQKVLQNDRNSMRGTYPFDDHTDVRTTVQAMGSDLRQYALDFLSGDLHTFLAVALR